MLYPKIDKIANSPQFDGLFKPAVLWACKETMSSLKELNWAPTEPEIIEKIRQKYDEFAAYEPKQIINATGIVIHTNLGRSPIGAEILRRASAQMRSYTNLEYDVSGGKRGDRAIFSSKLLNLLFGCEDALIVNNNAAAVFLVLNSLAKNKSAIVSRGELIEIGGSFRIPEVMRASGVDLVEVGTTNKTRAQDYADAIDENTALLMKAHKSNYDIIGFSSEASVADIAKIAAQRGLVSYYDLGSGYVGTLPESLSQKEPNLRAVLDSGVDIISFSGDKLFGGPQCGIILGKKSLIATLKKNQILRMLRVDKITLSILNETIKAYLNKEFSLIRALDQIHKSTCELEKNALLVLNSAKIPARVVNSRTFVGGGALPNKTYSSVALAFKKGEFDALKFRSRGVIGRVENDEFLLDFRSILDEQIPLLIKILKDIYE